MHGTLYQDTTVSRPLAGVRLSLEDAKRIYEIALRLVTESGGADGPIVASVKASLDSETFATTAPTDFFAATNILPSELRSFTLSLSTDDILTPTYAITVQLGENDAKITVKSKNNSSWAHGAAQKLSDALYQCRTWYGYHSWILPALSLLLMSSMTLGFVATIAFMSVVLEHHLWILRSAILGSGIMLLTGLSLSAFARFNAMFPRGVVIVRERRKFVTYNAVMFALAVAGLIATLVPAFYFR